MSFDKETYLKEKALQFVHEFNNPNIAIGLVGFKTMFRYYLSTLNNDADKKQFVKYALGFVYQFPTEEQEALKNYIYVLNGYGN